MPSWAIWSPPDAITGGLEYCVLDAFKLSDIHLQTLPSAPTVERDSLGPPCVGPVELLPSPVPSEVRSLFASPEKL